jgi:hypothetical protein
LFSGNCPQHIPELDYFTFEDTLSQIGFGYPETVPENLRPDDTSANLMNTNSRSSGALTYARETLLTTFLLGIAPDDTHE